MRITGITCKGRGAYHYVMNKGYDGYKILKKRSDKEIFLGFIKEFSEKL